MSNVILLERRRDADFALAIAITTLTLSGFGQYRLSPRSWLRPNGWAAN